MRPTSSLLVLALPSLCVAQAQVPLGDKIKGWFNKASEYIPTAAAAVKSSIPNPVAAGAAKIAGQNVHSLTLDNWKDVIATNSESAAQKDGPEEWLVFINGGNNTCYGLCGPAEKSWNQTVTLLSVTPNAPSFATIDCDVESLLCNQWVIAPPSIYQFFIPKPLADQSRPATTVRYIAVNRTSVTENDFLDLHNHPEKTPVYEGFFHPFDGLAQKTQFAVPWAYAMWGLSAMPSWAPMIIISLLSRTFMRPRQAPRTGAAGGAAPTPAAAR